MTKNELLAAHRHYESYRDEWLFYIRSYFGGKRYRDGEYLIQHPLESTENYNRRKKLAYFYNYCAPIVDIFTSLLYKNQPRRNFGSLTGGRLFDNFIEDTDLEGNSFSQFMREVARFASAYGRVSIIVDKPSVSAGTVANAIELDLRPYATMFTPENVIDWVYAKEPNGRPVLDTVKVVEDRDKDGNPTLVRMWSRNEWALYAVDKKMSGKDELEPVDMGVHGLGIVPLVNVYNKNAVTKMIGVSDLEDIAYINKSIYSLCSDIQEIVENTAFPMLAMPYEQGRNAETNVGPKSIVEFDPDSTGKPFWLEPPHGSLAEIQKVIGQHERTIYKIANLLGLKNSGESKQPWSGIALEIENQQRDAVLAEKAANAEIAERQIFELYARWEGDEFDGEITYPKDFSLKDMDRSTELAINALRDVQMMTAELRMEIEKKIARAMLGDISSAERRKVYEAIERGDTDEPVDEGQGEGQRAANS